MESSKGYKNWRCASHRTSSRVTLLQHQLQELNERACRARNHNQKLLQDFQRAQNTLSDLVARTEAMNKIRIEYERYLEENYPKWQQKLQDKRLSEQRKMIEQHLKARTPQTEEKGQTIDRGSKLPFRIHSSSATSSDPFHHPIFNSIPHISDHEDNMAEVLPLSNGDKERRNEVGRHKMQGASSNSQDDNHHMQKQSKNVNSSDTKPVNISDYYGDTSESSDLSSKAVKTLPTEDQRTRNKRSKEKQTHNTRKYAVSQGSSSISDSQSVPNHKKHMRNQQSNGSKTTFKTSKVTVDSPEQLVKGNEDDGWKNNPIEGKLTSISCTVKIGGMQRYEEKNETEEEKEILSTGMKRVIEVANRYSTENQEKRASLCEEQDKEEEDDEKYKEQSSPDEEKAQEQEALRSNTSVQEFLFEELDSVKESEAGEGGVGEEEEKDGDKRNENENIRASGRMSKEHDNESDQEGNYNEVLASGSERNIQDSPRELYKDETEDDLADKEASIEEEEEEEEEEDHNSAVAAAAADDDDDVIIEKASPWSCHPLFEDKYQDDDDDDDDHNDATTAAAAAADDDDDDDDDDDIEGLLAPQNNSLHHRADEPEEILKSKGLQNDSEENTQGKEEPVDSGDEFDYFYD